MKAPLAAAAAICALLITGCAATVSGAGVRESIGGASGEQSSAVSPASSASGQASQVPSSTSQPSGSAPASPSQSGASSVPPSPSGIRPMPPISVSSQSAPVGGSSQSTLAPTPPSSSSPPPATASTPATTPQQGGTTTAANSDDPATEFDGATSVDPDQYAGTVTDVGFQSPSGNITCGIQDGTVVCQINKYDYTPPKHDCGPSGWGFNFQLKPTKSAFLFCAGDVESGGPALAYGKQIVVGDVRCVSRQDGITCENTASGYGFRLARAAYVFFGPNDVSTTVGASGSSAPASIPSALVGEWGGHGRELTITASGSGTLTYRVYQFCSDDPTPPCDKTKGNEIISGGHIEFVLTGPSGTKAATGSVTSSNDPKTPVGTKVTATVTGYNLELSFWPGTMFCASDTPANQWNCGA